MKKAFLIFCIIMFSFSLSGCEKFLSGRSEIDDLTFIRVIGFDVGKNESIRVTASSKKAALQTSGGTSQPVQAINITAEGKTVFEAIRKLNLFSEKIPFFGHTEFILVSEKLAKRGLIPNIDFMTRDHELRLNSRIYIVKGLTAQELIEKSGKGDYFIAERLAHLEEANRKLSYSTEVPLIEAMYIFGNPYLSLYLPCIEMKKSMQKSEKGKFDVIIKGYGIFKNDKLSRFLNQKESRGLNWLRNLVKSGLIVVKDEKGEEIALEIIESKTKIVPLIKNGKLKATVKVAIKTNVGEIYGKRNIFSKKDLEYIEKKQEEIVKQEIMDTIQVAQDNKMDFFSTATHFFQKYPTVWEKYEKNWSEHFSNIDFDIQVNSNIMRSYQLNTPNIEGGK